MDLLTLEFNETSGLLEAYGANRLAGPVKTWTYGNFEVFNRSAISPSMYEWMATWLYTRLNNMKLTSELLSKMDDEWDLQAFNAYWEMPKKDRREFHDQILENLEATRGSLEEKQKAAWEAVCDPNMDTTSPIFVETRNFFRGLYAKTIYQIQKIDDQIHEEKIVWTG